MARPELEITTDLAAALAWVLGAAPSTPTPVVVVSACLDLLAKGYGLSESGTIDEDPLERADLPAPAMALIHHLWAKEGPEVSADTLRDHLYRTFVGIAQDPAARRTLNRNRPLTDVELLTLGQVYWNLEARGDRTRLPIQPGPITKTSKAGSQQIAADIRVPSANKDFATMAWTDRVNQKGSYKSSGQGFRTQGARLAVLAAEVIVQNSPDRPPDLEGAVLTQTPPDRGTPRIVSITWPGSEPDPAAHVSTLEVRTEDLADTASRPRDHSPGAQHWRSDIHRVLVGAPADVGADYQRRGFDMEIERLWADGGDRRIWLRGGPGLGKSYSARRVMQEAVVDQAPDREALLIWVDSADAAAVTQAFSDATDQVSEQGVQVHPGSQVPADRKAQALLGLLATSAWRWLIVLDNADAESLIEAGLIPPGRNRNGRVLLTTLSQDHRISSHGRVVASTLFTADEAESYLRSEVHIRGHGSGPLSLATDAETRALARALDYHPLALSIAAGTIVANAMAAADWIDEFTVAATMDGAADEPDRGGYPHLIGTTWQVALDRAAEGLHDGVVERAAMVAAVQDPDGHPTWLWDRPALAGWVAGSSTLARRHGVPVAVQRLIDSGIVELRGHTWRDGQVTIHQLAARAIRERAAPPALAELTGILLEQWLLEVTANPTAGQPNVLRRNLGPIAALPDLPTPARRTVTALLAYQQPTGMSFVTREQVEWLESYLGVGGATVRIKLAEQLVDLADEEATLGRPEQARITYGKAADLYRQLVEDDSLTEAELAWCLMPLGDLEARLGTPAEARTYRERAAALLERLVDTASDTPTTSSRLARLVTLHVLLGNPDGTARALVRAEKLLTRPLDDLPTNADITAVWSRGDSWRTLAGLMAEAGRHSAAKECLARATATYERSPMKWGVERPWAEAVQELALLHAKTGEWSDAERHLTRLTDIEQSPWTLSRIAAEFWQPPTDALVLLASVQTHLGRREDADRSLALAAVQYREHASDDYQSWDEWLDSVHDSDRGQLQEHRDELRRDFFPGLLKRLVADSAESGRWEEARGLSGSILDLAQQGAAAAPGDRKAEEALADAHELRGALLHAEREWDEAARHLTRAVGIRQMLAELDPSSAPGQRNLARALSLHASCLADAGRHQAGADSMTRCVNAYRRITELAPDDRDAAEDLAEALRKVARMEMGVGNLDAVVSCLEESISILSRLADPGNHTIQIDLADSLQRLGGAWIFQSQPEAAVEPLLRSIDTYSDVVAHQTAAKDGTRKQLAYSHLILGYALTQTDAPQDALTQFNEAVAAYRALAETAPDDREIQNNLALALYGLGDAHVANGQQEQAVDSFSRAANISQLLVDLDPGERPILLIGALKSLAPILRDLGRTDEADEALARANDLSNRYPDEEGPDDL